MATFDVPILLLMFNRPDHARQVFDRIRSIRPARLYVAVDGPRPNHPTDRANVARCLTLLDRIDWPCELVTLIRQENMGCGLAVSSAVTWFFGQVEMGIILEDDCLPDLSFFAYCRELLQQYEHNPSVMHIGGVNYQDGQQRGSGSYYFTKICHIWGWATWRRAWALYDFSLNNFPQFSRENTIRQALDSPDDQVHWHESFRKVHEGQLDTWDYQWVYAIWTHNALCALPNVNLVRNIGFDASATHTKARNLVVTEQPVASLSGIVHPGFVLEDKAATEYSLYKLFRPKTGWQKKIHRMQLRMRYRTWHI